MHFQEFALWASTIFIFGSSFRYIYSIVKWKTKPNVVGWLLYQIATLCVLISSYELGATSTIIASLAYAVNQLIIIILAFRYGYARMAPIEGIYFGVSIFSLMIWAVLVHSPEIASMTGISEKWVSITVLAINTFIDLMWAVAIFTKLYQQPETEDRLAWLLATISWVFSIIAVTDYTFHDLIYPIYLFTSNLAIWLLCFRRKPRHRFVRFFLFIQKFVGKSWRE
jgi:hypothetical protein